MEKKVRLENAKVKIEDGKMIIESSEIAQAISDEGIEVDGNNMISDEEAQGVTFSVTFD